jgi:aspartyl-tRNA(Asn)/glutamyl-tRNA(Gln) amidotransferase subunit A
MTLTDLGVAAAGECLRTKKVSALELAQAHLDRIAALNPSLNAYVTVTPERALADARRATEEIARGEYRGPLHGVPIGLKDLIDTAGIRTTYGSKVHASHVPTADAAVAQRLARAGAVLLGKHNTHEYAFGVTTTNPHHGATRNPWDPTRIPGGSSGGSGAAVAARLACAAIGTDTGGSVRIPAAACGVVGLKPTFGRTSKRGVFPMSFLFDHVGPITRTVEDAAIVLGAIAGHDPADPKSVPMPVDDWRARLADGVRGRRLGVPRSRLLAPLDPAVGAAFEAALATLGRLGASARDVELPELPMSGLFELVISEAKAIHADTLARRPHDLGADLQAYLSTPVGDAVWMAGAMRQVDAYAAAVRGVLEDVDLLVLPTCPIGAPRIGQDVVDVGGVELQTFFAMALRTAPFNAAGVPALSVPCGLTPDGLPIGLQVVGRLFDEATVLAAGHAYEQATEWHARRPPAAP